MSANKESMVTSYKFNDLLLDTKSSIKDALEVINTHSARISLIIDENKKLLGSITDGDIRRGILKGFSLEDSVIKIMNKKPKTVDSKATRKEILKIMKEKQLYQIPVIDDNNIPIKMETFRDLLAPKKKDNIVVLMAGGLGTRLGSMTENTPKPMLKVGGRPILETIISRFVEQGFYKFYISVNYLAEQVKSYFGDGKLFCSEEFLTHCRDALGDFEDKKDLGIEIKYLLEDKPLGTAGALTLLPESPQKPIIVMNGDIITSVKFADMLNFHKKNSAWATLGTREYNFQIPYGVIKVKEDEVMALEEKPSEKILINAGIYVISPEALTLIEKNTSSTMPELFEKIMNKNNKACAFPIRESWIDIGRVEDFVRAKK